MSLQFYTLLSLLLSLSATGALYALYVLKRERLFVPWLLTWGLLSIHFAVQLPLSSLTNPWIWGLNRWTGVLAALSFVFAAREYAGLPRRQLAFALLTLIGAAWTVRHATFWPKAGEAGGPLLMCAAICLWASISFWLKRRLRGSLGVRLLAAVSLVWCILNLAPAIVPKDRFTPVMPIFLTATIFTLLLMAMSMLMLAYEGVLKRVEDNMMSFSLLNLASTGQQTHGDLQAMLEKMLDRTLELYACKRGLLVIQAGDREPSTRVFRGWPAGFAEEWERRKLEDRLTPHVTQIGGFLVAPRLEDPGARHLLDAPDVSPTLGEILRSASVESLIALSIRSKDRVFGTMLLAPPPALDFSSAELRVLNALGLQAGMGIENFILMNNSKRRGEELNLLHQTGQAISSTLEVSPLLRCIHEELQKLMDARNFYLAMRDDERNEIRFEIEVEEGHYLEPRSRKMRHGLTEHILRTGEPLLIPRGFTAYRTAHGIELSGRPALSWCGTPVILRGSVVGVMAVQSYEKEDAYDEGHLEVLGILAAQAAVALENARLFASEQERLRHLTFLHNISRVAISTLNAEEMLAEIAREIHKDFGFEHVAIGLLDYDAKLVDWKAESGTTQNLVGRKAPMDTGLVGRAARGGRVALVPDVAAEPRFSGVLPGARSAVCLPIVYAEQMLGVLNIESTGALSQGDLPILEIMADHLATALHNAFTFQRTQEQAITDGLTGVKTHRYFMEALNGEWKRSTRSGRIFSLVVLDLDRFKQVNDTMGHLEGDLVLVRLGRILEERCRKSNVVARYGGDEFMVLMPETTTEQASILAERLRLWVATDAMFAERHLTASFGLATYPIHGHTPEEIIRAADAGLYLAKHQGGNHVAVAEQFRQVERWQGHVFVSLVEQIRTRAETTGPETMEKLIQRLEEIWQGPGANTPETARGMEKGLTDLADLMDERVHGSRGHLENTTRYAMMLAGTLGLSETQMQQIRQAARLHDVGYIAVPPDILEKQTKLSAQEFAAIHVHASAGARLLQAAHLPVEVCEIVRHHHEAMNGRGYPDGLPGERIPLGARILSLADAFEGITSDRPYRPARSQADALEEMERFAGTQFDPLLVRAFLRVMKSEVAS